jgi:hypothetical protein
VKPAVVGGKQQNVLMEMDGALERARQRRLVAARLTAEVALVDRWSAVGNVVQVGAVAYNLVVSPDIDFEVFTPRAPTVRGGFEVLAALAEHPRVTKARFWNALSTPDQGLYFQVRCQADDGQEWKVDTWLLGPDHPGPCAAWIVQPMRQALTDDLRGTIVRLKEARAGRQVPPVSSIDLYRAVIDDGVRTIADLGEWLDSWDSPGLTDWRPGQG